MLSTMVKIVITGCVAYKLYRRAEEAMKNDEEYLMKITGHADELAARMIDEARKHARAKEYELSAEYFYYAYKCLGSSWDHIIAQADSQEVCRLLHIKKSQEQ
ncbi:uncharacterized protein Eint_040890 [Encephalitozoon intestinalis ATCC 50506]|uniref:Uncharacterized protein n=1 Tax=Encephalitozoon intestinalis (strain ATCC 50506) TaxID=876142 RepID=E0S6P3_ENCIT|nr:uncharacterized protein Eint_040890 [Encephalitozoon intestinalis ATCC 50506]ADM11378.1 hypothetical protein Eint_040890 [Encephalitozoon intestinalis ATCC 50506]UTX45068.1 hypothetical protein GPK93_04g06060 [Encephalitozoon intestinalis]